MAGPRRNTVTQQVPEMIPPITPFCWSLAVIQSASSIRSTKLTGSLSCLNEIVSLAPFA